MGEISCSSTNLLTTISKDGNTSVIYFKYLSDISISLYTYNTLLFFPMTSIGSLPELTEKLKKTLQFRQQRLVVGPAPLYTARMIGNRVVFSIRTII
jgi:hypothetical protein